MSHQDRRLSDHILQALDIAIDQEELEVAEHLVRALEESLTKIGGEGVEDHRELSEATLLAFDRLDRLRRRALSA